MKNCKIIVLPTKEETHLHLDVNNYLHHSIGTYSKDNNSYGSDVELYLIDMDAELMDNDLFINLDYIKLHKLSTKFKKEDIQPDWKKVIACTNVLLKLPLFSYDSLDLLANFYNENKSMPEIVNVEDPDYKSWYYNGGSPVGCKINKEGMVDVLIPICSCETGHPYNNLCCPVHGETINNNSIIDAIKNLIGYIDTPIGRRKYPKAVHENLDILKKWVADM